MATSKNSSSKATNEKEVIVITPPRFGLVEITIRGTAPLMMHRFSKKAEIMAKQEKGSAGKGKTERPPRDFAADAREAAHVTAEGWYGIPASAFRAACIAACRLCGMQMVKAKMTVFVLEDGLSTPDKEPMVRLIGGEPEESRMHVRISRNGTDIRARPLWKEWGAKVRIRWDLDQFTRTDLVNLFARAGYQVGILEGRPASKSSDSPGLGFGTWEIVEVVDLSGGQRAVA